MPNQSIKLWKNLHQYNRKIPISSTALITKNADGKMSKVFWKTILYAGWQIGMTSEKTLRTAFNRPENGNAKYHPVYVELLIREKFTHRIHHCRNIYSKMTRSQITPYRGKYRIEELGKKSSTMKEKIMR